MSDNNIRDRDKLSIEKPDFKILSKIESQVFWWVKISTIKPFCIYYFGPFESENEAELAQFGYIDDLRLEQPGSIDVEINLHKPKLLTISAED